MHLLAALSLPDRATPAPALGTQEPGCPTTPSLEVLRWTSVQRICGYKANGRGTVMDCGFYGGAALNCRELDGSLSLSSEVPKPQTQDPHKQSPGPAATLQKLLDSPHTGCPVNCSAPAATQLCLEQPEPHQRGARGGICLQPVRVLGQLTSLKAIFSFLKMKELPQDKMR